MADSTPCGRLVPGRRVGLDHRIAAGAIVDDSVLFDAVHVGARSHVHRVILDDGVRSDPA